MTNEEIVEELYHKAYKKGFIVNLREEVDRIKIQNTNLDRVDVVNMAYKKCKSKKM